MRLLSILTVALLVAALAAATLARPALAAPPPGACGLTGLVPEAAGTTCPPSRATPGPRPNFLGLPIGKILTTITGKVIKTLGLATIVAWVVDGASAALRATVSLVGSTTRPNLGSTWFAASYWRMAAVSALLTLPFLFAAGIHALVRSDIGLIGRAAFGYLPLAFIGVGLAAPLTTLLLAATDEMSAFVAAASGHADGAFLVKASAEVSAAAIVNADPFIAFFVGLMTVGATLALWVELLVRDAAVYVIVLMLPLFFAAMVWPARRTWAIRAVETLFALILAKFAIVSVLALGGAALTDGGATGPARLLVGATLILLATLSPWALLRLLPLHEVAAAAAGGLSQGPQQAVSRALGMAADGPAGLLALGARPDDPEAPFRFADADDAGSADRGSDDGAESASSPSESDVIGAAATEAGLAGLAGSGSPVVGGPVVSGPAGSSDGGDTRARDDRPPMDTPLAAPSGSWQEFTIDGSDAPVIDRGDAQPPPGPPPPPGPTVTRGPTATDAAAGTPDRVAFAGPAMPAAETPGPDAPDVAPPPPPRVESPPPRVDPPPVHDEPPAPDVDPPPAHDEPPAPDVEPPPALGTDGDAR